MEVPISPSSGEQSSTQPRRLRAPLIAMGALASALVIAISASGEMRGQELRAAFARTRTEQRYPILAPCTRLDDVYIDLFYDSEKFDDWPDKYHENVNEVIEEHLNNRTQLNCQADTYDQLLRPGPKMLAMAAKLPPWKDPLDLAELSASDVSVVLYEYLRVYECILVEYNRAREHEIRLEMYLEQLSIPLPFVPVILIQPVALIDQDIATVASEAVRRRGIILEELEVARKVLDRAAGAIGTVNRLRPLQAELECIQRASLDLRNATALSAEASACLPRTWDALNPLRDLKKEE